MSSEPKPPPEGFEPPQIEDVSSQLDLSADFPGAEPITKERAQNFRTQLGKWLETSAYLPSSGDQPPEVKLETYKEAVKQTMDMMAKFIGYENLEDMKAHISSEPGTDSIYQGFDVPSPARPEDVK